jgi:drug/metabolite transporter (DMT)-like permease
MLGGLLALLSAAAFSLNNAAARRGVLSGSVLQAMAISVPFGVPFFFAGLLIFGSLEDLAAFSPRQLAWLSAAGVLHFIVGRYANYRGAKAVGTNLMGPVQDVNIVISLGLAVWLLGEQLTPVMMAGVALVCFGPLLAIERKPEKRKPAPSGFTPAYAEGFFFAGLSAFAYGSSPIMIRFAFEGGAPGLGAGVAAGLVSYLAATALLGAVLLVPGAFAHARQVSGEGAKWFLLASVSVGLAQMLRYMALALVPVTIVAPMMRLTAVFRFWFAWIVNREHESFSGGVIWATLVSLAGALLLTVNVDTAAQWLGLPEPARAFLRTQWP